MMQSFGLVGHPNAGKSSLFNVLTGDEVLSAPYPFATVDANLGVAAVPDERLAQLAEMSQSKKTVPASVHFTDIGGLVKGASEGEGLGNQFLSSIREADAIVYVLRGFRSRELPEPEPATEQLEILEVELSLADLESAEKQLEKRQRQAKAQKTPSAQLQALEQAVEVLKTGVPVYRSQLDPESREALKACFLLTNKPVLAVLNIDERELKAEGSDSDESNELDKERDLLSQALGGGEVIPICVGLEAEAQGFSEAERVELLKGYGFSQDALYRLVKSAYNLLGLRTFFTAGPRETRAWTFKAGSTAQQCAGAIHTDMERGFIRADCISTEELLACGSIQTAREAGKVAGAGRDYLVKDGDVLEIRFNV